MTRARGLHATRSRFRSENDASSLPERRIERRFVLFRWHRAHTCHALKCQVCDLCRPMAWFSGAYDLFWNVSLSIETPLRTPPPDKPWARPTRTRVRTVHSAILRLAGVLHGHNLLRAPHKHLQRLCKIWSLVRRITSEVAAAGAAATVSSLSLSGMPIQCGCG
jgi:hypothetical protein